MIFILKILAAILSAIAIFNIGIGALFTIEKIQKTFGGKANAWTYVYVIVFSLGISSLIIYAKNYL